MVQRRECKNDKPTLPMTRETWSDVDELTQKFELDKKVIAARVFKWLLSQGDDVQEPILRAHTHATTPDFVRLVLNRIAEGEESATAGRIGKTPRRKAAHTGKRNGGKS